MLHLRRRPAIFTRLAAAAAARRQSTTAELSALLPRAKISAQDDANVPDGQVLLLRHPEEEEPLAHLLTMPRAGNLMIYGASTRGDLPLSACAPLLAYAVSAAAAPDAQTGYTKQIEAAAALPGLCEWAAGQIASAARIQLEGDHGADAVEAAEAIALGKPRAGHEVLGGGTFRAATPAWEALATHFAGSAAAEECELYRAAGATNVGVVHQGDMRPESVASSGGAIALLTFAEKMSPRVEVGPDGKPARPGGE